MDTVGIGDATFWYYTGEIALCCHNCHIMLYSICHNQSKKNGKYYCVKCFDKILIK